MTQAGQSAAQVAHRMMFEDAAWATDVLCSAREHEPEPLASLLAPLLVGHWSRIIYEGSRALRSSDAHVAVPELAELLEHQHAAVVARARHSTKLFDDIKRSYDEVLAGIAELHAEHRARFTGNAVWFARWLETDLGLTLLGRELVGTTINAHMHMGQPADAIRNDADMGAAVLAASKEQGSALAVLLKLGGQLEPLPSLELAAFRRLRTVDRDTRSYVARRYDTRFPIPLKLLLLGLESDLSTCELVLPDLSTTHEDAVFRARVVTIFHALRALSEIANRYGGADDQRVEQLATILNDPAVQRLSTRQARAVRNQCVHYEVRGAARDRLRPDARMHGLVEALAGRPFRDFDEDTAAATRLVTASLRSWRG